MSDEPREEFSIHWIRDIVDRVAARDVDSHLISTGKSPSGVIHIGFMREIIIADIIKRELVRMGHTARTMFVVDDYDPLRAFPPGITLSPEDWLGVPYSDIPDEFGCCESFGAHWANQLIESFPEFGVEPEVVWTSKLYETPEMRQAVRVCLKNTPVLRDIMVKYVARDFSEEQRAQYVQAMKTWYPASVVCPECGRLQAGGKGAIRPNRVLDYDPDSDEISFRCEHCGTSMKLPFEEARLKLTWRVDWPTKWYVLGVTCEPAGKDHAVKGGSYDTGLEISRRVFGWPGPVKVPYEWVRIGGRDMSTSSGIVFTPRSWSHIAPPELFRYLMLTTDIERAVNIRPENIPDAVDQYDRFERVYYGVDGADEQRVRLARLLYPLMTRGPPRPDYLPKLPFKYAVVMAQLRPVLGDGTVMERCRAALMKQYSLEAITDEMEEHMEVRLARALAWVREFGTERDRIEIADVVPEDITATFTDDDREFLARVAEFLRQGQPSDEEVQTAVFELARSIGIRPKRAFMVLYRLILSRKSGPRLGPLVVALGPRWVADRISSVL